MELIAKHPGWYYLAVVLASLILPVIHPGLSLVSLALWIGMVPVQRRARKMYPVEKISMKQPVAAPPVRPVLGPIVAPAPASTPAPAPVAHQPAQTVSNLTGERLEVVGTHYYSGIDNLTQGHVPAELRREPRNPHDRNAIAVWAGAPLARTGHISRNWAAVYAPLMDAVGANTIRVPGVLEPYDELYVYMPDLTENIVGQTPPAKPDWEPVDPWGRPTHYIRLEAANLDIIALRKAVTTHANRDRDDSAFGIDGVAIRSKRGVSILIDGREIGHLDAGDAVTYAEPLARLARNRQGLAVTCDLWAASFDPSYSNMSIRLPEPNEVEPPDTLPTAPHVVLPGKSKIQVTGEDAYLNELTQILGGESRVPVAVTLHETEPASGRGKPYVEVRIADEAVGKLTPTMSEHMLPIVRACAEEHLLVVCRAAVEGNHLKADVVLDTTKSGDLPQEWILEHVQAPDDYELPAIPQAPTQRDEW